MIRSELRLPTSLTCRELLTAGTTAACISFPPTAIRCEPFWVMLSDVRFANHTPMLTCTVSWRIVGYPEVIAGKTLMRFDGHSWNGGLRRRRRRA